MIQYFYSAFQYKQCGVFCPPVNMSLDRYTAMQNQARYIGPFKKKKKVDKCQKLEVVVCLETCWDAWSVCNREWVRPFSGEVMPCSPYSPARQCLSIRAHWRHPPSVLSNPATEWPSDQKSHLGGRSMVGQGFKKANHKARALIFNSTLVLRFSTHYTSGIQELVAICLFFCLSCHPGFLSFFSF